MQVLCLFLCVNMAWNNITETPKIKSLISCYLCCSVVICAVLLLLCCTVVICVVLLLFVLIYVLFVCKCLLYHCHRVFTQLQLTNISIYKIYIYKRQDSTDSISTRYRLDGPGIESWWGARFSTPVQTSPGVHPASFKMCTRSLPGGKVAGAWHWSPTSI